MLGGVSNNLETDVAHATQAASDNWVSTITAYGEEERRTVTLGHVCFISFASKMHEIA